MKDTLERIKKFLLTRKKLSVTMIVLLVLAIYGITLLINGDENTIVRSYSTSYEGAQINVDFGDKDNREEASDIIEVLSAETFRDHAVIRIKAKASGSETLNINIHKVTSEGRMDYNDTVQFDVGPGGLIYNNLYEDIYIVLSFVFLLLMLYFILLFVHSMKTNRYSYNCIFYLAMIIIFAIVLAVWCGSSIYSLINHYTTASDVVALINQNLMSFAVLLSVPVVFLYAVAVTVSNLVLMKREGFRPANSLGIITGSLMAVGVVIIAILTSDPLKSKALTIVTAVLASLFVFFEAVLISSVFCGVYASRFKPRYDKDYIIILGCRIRPDGTLYPLVRGRVDKAISFYKKQLEKTGKKAYFVPSGGQGSDEIMSEAEAMKNYLVEQGIPEEQILPETASTTTKENMQFSKKIIDEKKENAAVIFSTTSYHVFRSGIIASEAGIKIDGIGSKTKWYFWPNAFLREVAGLFVNQPKIQLVIMLAIVLLAGAGSFVYSLL